MVTAVIVTFNSGNFLGRAVESCQRFGVQVVVVDNGSTDGTEFPQDATVLRNEENRGFAGGVNQGVRACSTPLILLLNPDAELLTPVEKLCDIAVANRHTAAAGILVEADGQAQKGFSIRRLPTAAALAFEVLGINRIWPRNPVNRSYRCFDLDLSHKQLVEQPAGAFMLFRRDDWEELGGFDEGFWPVWFEDVDFAKRFRELGGTMVLEPAVRALHHGGHSVQKLPNPCRIEYWYGSLLRYTIRHHGPFARRLVAGSVFIGLAVRMVFGIFQLQGLPVIGAQARSMQSAVRSLFVA